MLTRTLAIALVWTALLTTWDGRLISAVQAPAAITLEPIGSIGVESGDPHLEFGSIEGIAVDEARGVLFLVDRLNHRLSAFTRTGRFIAAVGRVGSGPGEFRSAGPVASQGSNVHVLDHIKVSIATYELRGDSLVWIADTRVPFNARDLCVLDGEVFLLGYHRGRMVHRLNLKSEEVTASFGRPFREGDAVMAAFTSSGFIRCDAESRSVYVTAHSTPTVRRYSPDGALLWESSIPDIATSVITRAGSGVRFGPPQNRESSDAVVSLVPLGRRLLLQFGEGWRGLQSFSDIVDVTSVMFETSSGTVVRTYQDLPRVDYASGGLAYSHINEPFPKIVTYRLR